MKVQKGTNPFGMVNDEPGSSASHVSPSPARTSVKSLGSAGRSTAANRAGRSVSFAGGAKTGLTSCESVVHV